MSIPKFSVNNSLFVNLVSVLILVVGLATALGMNREVFPNVAFDIMSVSTFYPGATPEDVEKLITTPLEKELREVDGIKEITSTSAMGSSMIYVSIDPDEKDKTKVMRDIRNAVDRARDLPRDIYEDPIVTEVTTRQYPIIEVSLSGDMSEFELRRHADMLEELIEDIPGVARVRKAGFRDREVQVLVDENAAREHYVSLDEIERALNTRNISIPAGSIDTQTTEYSIRTTGEFTNASEIEEVIIRANDAGNWLKVKDVAEVKDTFKDEEIIYRTLGTRSINLVIMKKESGDALTIVDRAREVSEDYREKFAEGLGISFVNDYAFFARRRLNVLSNNALIGIIIVTASMLVFLQKKVAFLTVLGIPIAFLATFIVMNALGVTINLMSMFGLIIVLGMLVDDGIIVAENVYRHMEDGETPRTAAVRGTEEVMGAICTAVFTTILAFSPLLFMTGIMGKFIRNIPLVVIIALLASLGEALVILPSHLADFVKIKTDKTGKTVKLSKDLKWFRWIVNNYTRLVTWAIKRKYSVVAGIMCLFVVFGVLGGTVMRFVLFPRVGINYFFIRVEAPIGTPLSKTSALIMPIEDIVAGLADDELDSYVTNIGKIESDRQDPLSGQGSHLAQITVYLTQSQDRDRKVEEIISELRQKIRAVEGFDDVRFDIPGGGPPVGKPVEVRIRGEDFEILDEIAFKYMDFLKTIPGTVDVTWDNRPGKEEIRVRVDNQKAKTAGLSVGQVARTVRGVFQGNIATTIKPVRAEKATDVTVRYASAKKASDISVFEQILISNERGKLIPLKNVASIEKVPSINTIRHLDGQRVVTVSSNLDETVTTSMTVNRMLQEHFTDISDEYMGYSVKYGGEQEETIESLVSFVKAFIVAFLMVYMLLASFFKSLLQPFVVMLAIPFGLIGVIAAFLAHGLPFSFMAVMGVVGLNGIVVNDSIVLVDFINKLRRSGLSRAESIIRAGQLRIRAVLLTTLTTVGGLSTVAYGIGGRDPFLVPMAIALCWGLIFATFLTLVIIPCVYSMIDDLAIKCTKHDSMICVALFDADGNGRSGS